MAIVSSVIESSCGKHFVEVHTDHLGTVYRRVWLHDGSVNPEDVLSQHATDLADQLAQSEIETVLNND